MTKIRTVYGRGTSPHDLSISVIRLVSICMVILCHIFQALDIELAWWFNVGVQIFLCISGWLYGQKHTADITRFYHSRLMRILAPYYIVYIPFGIIELIFARNSFNTLSYIRGIFLNDTIAGAGHLWFVPTILMCYFLTPILEAYRDKYANELKSFCCFALVSLIVISLFFGLFNDYFNPAWIICYTLGYFLGSEERKRHIEPDHVLLIFGIVALVGNAAQIYCSYIANIRFTGYSVFCDLNHVLLGVFLFLIMKRMLKNCNLSGLAKLLNVCDSYSYEIYLVHVLIILGPFSLVTFTSIPTLNIFLILFGIVFMAIIVKQIEKPILKVIDRRAD